MICHEGNLLVIGPVFHSGGGDAPQSRESSVVTAEPRTLSLRTRVSDAPDPRAPRWPPSAARGLIVVGDKAVAPVKSIEFEQRSVPGGRLAGLKSEPEASQPARLGAQDHGRRVWL